MNRELLRKLNMFISGSLIASSNLLLIACDNKVSQEESKKSNQIIKPVPGVVAKKIKHDKGVSEPRAQNENVKAIAKVIEPAVKVTISERSMVDSTSSDSKEIIVVEEERNPEAIILDLSLKLDFDEKYYHQKGFNKKSLSGVFEFEEDVLDLEMETHFEWPHIENKEQESTPDGIGVGIKVGI